MKRYKGDRGATMPLTDSAPHSVNWLNSVRGHITAPTCMRSSAVVIVNEAKNNVVRASLCWRAAGISM